MSLPTFTGRGILPPGIHEASWTELAARFGMTPRRRRLLGGLRSALISLKTAGCTLIYVDGSFVTSKPQPGDFDACWSVTGVDPALLDSVLLTFDNGRAAQKVKFGGELFPAEVPKGMSGGHSWSSSRLTAPPGRQKELCGSDSISGVYSHR